MKKGKRSEKVEEVEAQNEVPSEARSKISDSEIPSVEELTRFKFSFEPVIRRLKANGLSEVLTGQNGEELTVKIKDHRNIEIKIGRQVFLLSQWNMLRLSSILMILQIKQLKDSVYSSPIDEDRLKHWAEICSLYDKYLQDNPEPVPVIKKKRSPKEKKEDKVNAPDLKVKKKEKDKSVDQPEKKKRGRPPKVKS